MIDTSKLVGFQERCVEVTYVVVAAWSVSLIQTGFQKTRHTAQRRGT
jgi:hypothetical protein